MVNSSGETRDGLLKAALSFLSRTRAMKMRNVSSTSSRVFAGTAFIEDSHDSSRGAVGYVVAGCESIRYIIVARHAKSLPRSWPQSRSSPNPSSPRTIDCTSRMSVGNGPGIACIRSDVDC